MLWVWGLWYGALWKSGLDIRAEFILDDPSVECINSYDDADLTSDQLENSLSHGSRHEHCSSCWPQKTS
jgi:hypothetical protein